MPVNACKQMPVNACKQILVKCGVVKADIRITFIMLKRFKRIAVDLSRRPIGCQLVCAAGQFVAGQLIKTNFRRLICPRLIDEIPLFAPLPSSHTVIRCSSSHTCLIDIR